MPEHQPDYAASAWWLFRALIATLIYCGVVIPGLAKLQCWAKRMYVYMLYRRRGARLCTCGDPRFVHNDNEDEGGWCAICCCCCCCCCKKFVPAD